MPGAPLAMARLSSHPPSLFGWCAIPKLHTHFAHWPNCSTGFLHRGPHLKRTSSCRSDCCGLLVLPALAAAQSVQVLYVGDHIWADVLRSKKALGWRTLLVVPELDAELDVLARCKVGEMVVLLCCHVASGWTACTGRARAPCQQAAVDWARHVQGNMAELR